MFDEDDGPKLRPGEVSVGQVYVDSGTIILIPDPCYMTKNDKIEANEKWYTEQIVDRCYEKTNGANAYQSFGMDGPGGLGVVTATGYGDGAYPVFAKAQQRGARG